MAEAIVAFDNNSVFTVGATRLVLELTCAELVALWELLPLPNHITAFYLGPSIYVCYVVGCKMLQQSKLEALKCL